MSNPYRFQGRTGDTYYWSRECTSEDLQGYEEVVSCNVAWFWGGAA